ncbi:MAG: hypothetical protein L0287_27515, partial [Anaerolineae bacterium]|nr:hypothetical protein [Anaerolineae bacterium]
GGWEFEITLLDECDLDTIRDHALVVLFAEEYYGDTNLSIGPLVGCENVILDGWIAKEEIDWNPEQGSVKFTGHGAHAWLGKIASYPDGVEIVPDLPTAWTQMKGLTIKKGLWHFLHWRTTATRVIDVFLPDSTLYTRTVSSLAQNLWDQLLEMAFLQIFARPGVNAHNQLFIQVHPQLVPEEDRDWPTVMDIQKRDWVGQIQLERATIEEVSQVSLSGVSVNQNGKGTPFFALSTGHTFGHFGAPITQDHLLVESQAQTNELCGLYYGWRNNPFKDIPVTFAGNIRLIDCFPRQMCTITIDPEDTPRGISYVGGIIPKSVSLVYDENSGYIHTEVIFEAETFAALAVNGDVPGSGDISVPPVSSLPPIPPFPILIPGVPEPTAEGPLTILHDQGVGHIYASLGGTNPQWVTMNAGLTAVQYQNANFRFVCPSGSVYVGRCSALQNSDRGTDHFNSPFIARAPSIGGTFVIIEDEDSLWAKYPEHPTLNHAIKGIAYNPLLPEKVAYIMGQNTSSLDTTDFDIYIGAGASFAAGANITNIADSHGFLGLSYGMNKWLYTGA